MRDKPNFCSKKIKVQAKLDNTSALAKTIKNNPIPIFNLSEMTTVELSKSLKSLLNKSSLTEHTFIFTGKRYNKKLELERDRISGILDAISLATSVNKSLIQFQADTFLSQAVLEDIINNYPIEAKRKIELLAKGHENEMQKLEDEIETRRLTLQAARSSNAKVQAEVDLLNERIAVIKLVRGSIQISDLKDDFKGQLILKSIDPDSPMFSGLDFIEGIKQAFVQTLKADADKATHEADRVKTQADLDKFNKDETIKAQRRE